MEHGPWSHLIGRAGKNTWNLLHNPAILELRGKCAELATPRAKLVALFDQGSWGMGQLESRPQRALTALGLLLLLHLGWETKFIVPLTAEYSLQAHLTKEPYQSTEEAARPT